MRVSYAAVMKLANTPLIVALALILAAPAWAEDYNARVVGVSDGDTLTVLTDRK